MTNLILVALASAVTCAILIVALKPLLVRYALARPNARSSHRSPTPQGGGIAVMAATFATAAVALGGAAMGDAAEIAWISTAAFVLALTGVVDDIHPLSALPRLVMQIMAVTVVVTASADARILPDVVPLWLERSLVVLAGVWFVNLVNFMDGIDWITTAETVPITAVIALLGAAGVMPFWIGLIGAALCGALLGFAPFNRPVAKLFLGDVGSLPIGLLVGWMLLELAATGAIAAVILLPLYYLADATVTLLRRLARGERIWEAHRGHFYQQAIDRSGFSVLGVVTHVFVLNLALAALAACTIVWPAWSVQLAALLLGAIMVGFVLWRFSAPAVRVPA
ncbi:MAG TPA: glycosyltransferase family 4 protein [Beijerinckiaceae bacterium]|jgi:UDP-N-acetylmuramyl pentapeptide phosphotransferase/UDP-N-acetylglucosamine-1-phosphate transferase